MPIKGKGTKGDLYLTSDIIFPEDGCLNSPTLRQQLSKLLPSPSVPESPGKERKVDYDDHAVYDFDADAKSKSDQSDSEDSDAEHVAPGCAPQ